MLQHSAIQLQIVQPYVQSELQLGPQWKVAPLDALHAKLRDYFGKDLCLLHISVSKRLGMSWYAAFCLKKQKDKIGKCIAI